MTRTALATAESFAAGSFAISALLTALRTSTLRGELHTERAVLDRAGVAFQTLADVEPAARANLLGPVTQPSNPVLWALLAAVILAAVLHAARPRRGAEPARLPAMQIGGLLLAAAWPWVLNPAPLAGLALAALSCGLLIAGLIANGQPTRDGWRGLEEDAAAPPARPPGVGDLPMGFIAGWVLMAATSAVGMYVHHHFGLGVERSVLLGLLPAALLGAWGQLAMNRPVSFALALIWAMIGFAAATAGASIVIATACVLGISALAVVLVRVTT